MVNSLNVSEIYNIGTPEATVSSWFKVNYLVELAGNCVDIVRNRKNGDSWPLSTFDIISIASTNIEMDIITQLREKYANQF